MKANELQVDQRHEDVEIKREYYHIIIFPERTWNFTSRQKRASENYSNGTLEKHKSGPANKQHTYQPINQNKYAYGGMHMLSGSTDMDYTEL